MSLDTILQIGKVLRYGAKDPMKHFKYVASPKDKEENYPICITIPVNEDFSFDFSKLKGVCENQRESLYYLRYKTSDSDSSAAKYVFGDVFYKKERNFDKKGKIKESKESGNYIIQKSNAFSNAENTRKEYVRSIIENIDSILPKQKKIVITEILKIINGAEESSDEIKNIVLKNRLFRFWESFVLNKEKIELLLEYAPLFEDSSCLYDIQNRYIQYVFKHKYDKIKTAVSGKKNIEELSETEKNEILKFADHSAFIHFEFNNDQQWYDIQDVFKLITDTLNKELTQKQNEDLLVPVSFIYRTLCSGNNKNDIQFPAFDFSNSHKSFAFKEEEQFRDFLYATTIMNKPKLWIKGSNINVYVYPVSFNGQQIDAENYESFFFDNRAENSLFSFDFLSCDSNEKFTRFDFVFSDSGGNTTKDLIEISGIGRSELLNIKMRIATIEDEISKEKERDLSWKNVQMKLENSFTNIFGKISFRNNDLIFDNKNPNYQSHMMKILPLIYTSNYYNDERALCNLIDKVEFSVRSGIKGGNYSLLKYDFKLITSIQNNVKNKYMEITESKSYQLGVKIGKLSKPLKNEINSFEKTYVGLLTRRVATKSDCIQLVNDIIEKLTMHKRAWSTMCAEVCSELATLPLSEYDKEKIAFGFFEGYFKFEPTDKKKDFQSRLEKLLSDYEGNEELKDEVEKLSELVEEINDNLK